MHLVQHFSKIWFHCRRIVVLGLPASHLPCEYAGANGKYGGCRSSSKPAYWMAASAWANVWSCALSWLQVTSMCFLNWKNLWKGTNFLTMRTLSEWQMAGSKTKNNSSSTVESELSRNTGPSAFQWQATMLKSDKIWCAHLVVNCIRLRTFWTPLVLCGRCSSLRRMWNCIILSYDMRYF